MSSSSYCNIMGGELPQVFSFHKKIVSDMDATASALSQAMPLNPLLASSLTLTSSSALPRSHLPLLGDDWEEELGDLGDIEPTPFREGFSLKSSSSTMNSNNNNLSLFVPAKVVTAKHHARTVSYVSDSSDDDVEVTVATGTSTNKSSLKRKDDQDEPSSAAASSPERKRAKTTAESSSSSLAVSKPIQEAKWGEFYQALLAFKQEHGHCHVPHTYPQDPSLARWAKRQRYQYKLRQDEKPSSMTPERIQKLESVGFIWDPQTCVWETRRQELVQYLQEHGNCNVPCRYSKNPQLGMWVKRQRRQYKLFQTGRLSRLSPERFRILTDMGFEWERRSESPN